MDRQWLRNLAQSEYNNGGWQLADPSNPSYLAHTHVQDILNTLFTKVKDAIGVFNTHADERKQLRIYQLTLKAGARPCGFAVMIKNLQVKLEQQGNVLKTEAILMRGYQTISVPIRIFEPHFDTFGEVSWIMDHKIPMEPDRMIRLFLEDALRMGYESGVIPFMPLAPLAVE
jgi:hypothetical protein